MNPIVLWCQEYLSSLGTRGDDIFIEITGVQWPELLIFYSFLSEAKI